MYPVKSSSQSIVLHEITERTPPNPWVARLVVGSTNPVKVAAVAQVVQRVWPQAEVVGLAVASGVATQPLSDEEAITGAINRAQRALAIAAGELGVGLEGNTVETPYGMFTTAWVAIADRAGRVGLGSSGRLLLPAKVAESIRCGAELGPLMDEVAGEHNTKQRQGAVGILTNGLVTRQAALESAVVYALARFVQPLYE
ncbi:MAG TPA: inosine/xanthosine triphosphatase [Caldilineaceae bacterium]|nr:inosine/xanthosine triphosphatase [Caldilineaceae bacterium]